MIRDIEPQESYEPLIGAEVLAARTGRGAIHLVQAEQLHLLAAAADIVAVKNDTAAERAEDALDTYYRGYGHYVGWLLTEAEWRVRTSERLSGRPVEALADAANALAGGLDSLPIEDRLDLGDYRRFILDGFVQADEAVDLAYRTFGPWTLRTLWPTLEV